MLLPRAFGFEVKCRSGFARFVERGFSDASLLRGFGLLAFERMNLRAALLFLRGDRAELRAEFVKVAARDAMVGDEDRAH